MSAADSGDPGGDALTERLFDLVTGSWAAQALHAAADLGVAEMLAGGPRTSVSLAAEAGAHAPSLHRLLRALCTLDVCLENEDGSFAITALGARLAADHPRSLRSWTLWWGGPLWAAWGNLHTSVRTGRSARSVLEGTDRFERLNHDERAAGVFNQAMVEMTRLLADSLVEAGDWSRFSRIVDVGGGHGGLLAALLAGHPRASGVLFDLPHASRGARRHLEMAGVAGRCEIVEGDFFVSLPPGADAYVLKSVLHDWDEKDALRILSTCRHAMGERARLLVVERLLPERIRPTPAARAVARSDLTMLVARAACERTAGEYRELLARAGFRVVSIVPAGQGFSLIEAAPGA
jgi:hypothetical protein